MNADDDRARRCLASLSLFPAEGVRAASITRLFGLTNEVFRVEIAGESLCLRIPGSGTAALIDRRREEANARAAARAGVAPEVLHFSADGVMLTRFIEGAPLSPQRFREDPNAIGRAARALADLHHKAERFAGIFDVFERIAFYRDLLDRQRLPRSPPNSAFSSTRPRRSAWRWLRSPPAACHVIATRQAAISSIPAIESGSSTGNIPA